MGDTGKQGESVKQPTKRKDREFSDDDEEGANASRFNVALELALAKQLASLESAVTKAVHNAIDGVKLSFDNAIDGVKLSVDNVQKNMDTHMETIKGLVGKVERIQGDARALKWEVANNSSELEKLRLKMASLEDQDRRNNVRITGLAAGREGGDATAFLQNMLPKWIPTLSGEKIQMERAHRIHSSRNDGQATMIFKLLRYQDRNAILQGAREARKNAPIQDEGRNIRFYADYSAFTNDRRRAYAEVMKELHERRIPGFLIYPATLRMTVKGAQRTFGSAQEATRFLREEFGERG